MPMTLLRDTNQFPEGIALENYVEPVCFFNASGEPGSASKPWYALIAPYENLKKALFCDIVDCGKYSFQEYMEQVRSKKLSVPVKTRIKSPKTGKPVLLNILPIKDERGHLCALCTATTEAPGFRDMIGGPCKSVFENAVEPMMILDGNSLRLLAINTAAENMTGYKTEDLEGKHYYVLYSQESEDTLRRSMEELKKEGMVKIDNARLVKKDGGTIRVETGAKLVRHDGERVVFASLKDISDRDQTASEIKTHNDVLSGINYISSMINSTLDIDVVLDRSIHRACEITGMPIGCIFLYDRDGQILIPTSYAGISQKKIMRIGNAPAGSCFEGNAIREKKPMVIEDLSKYSGDMGEVLIKNGIRSIISIPLVFQDQALGVMDLASHDLRHVSGKDIKYFSNMAGTIASAVNNAGYVGYVRSQAQKFSILFRTTRVLTSTLELKEVLNLFSKNTSEAVGASACAVYFYDEANDRLIFKASYNIDEKELAGRTIKPESKVLEIIRTRRPATIDDVEDTGMPADVIRKSGIKSILGIPLVYRSNITGVIFLMKKIAIPGFSPSEIDLSASMANLAAQAIENARLVGDLRKRTDEMRRVYEIQRRITQSISLEETLESIVSSAPYILNLPYSMIFLIDPNYQEITSIKATEELMKKHGKIKFKMGDLIASKIAIRDRKPVVIEDTLNFKDIARPIVLMLNMRTCIVLPLIARGRVLGVMWLFGTEAPVQYSGEDVRRAVALSDQAAIAIDNARLFKDLAEANRQLEDSYEKLKDLDNVKMEFFTLISHELRTPLTTIKGFTELLHDEVLGELNEQQRDKLDRINASVDKLTDIVSKLSDISSIESRRFPINRIPVSINELINEVVRSITFLAESKNIQIKADVPMNIPIIRVDRHKIEQVILNIINNAIKYTPPGGNIYINVRDREEDVLVSIRDTGIGIPRKDLEKIFTGFYHAEYKLSYEYKGTGLGLAISKGIIESHGGQIWVESEVGKGSTFYFTLPKEPGSQQEGL